MLEDRQRMEPRVLVPTLFVIATAVVLLLPRLSLALDPPDPLNVLFVANGWYDHEDDIESHLLDLGYEVTVKKSYQVYGSTDLSAYDLIVITEFSPGLSYSALGNIEASEVPVLIVEYWDFWYSYKLGLTSTEYCGYVGTDSIEAVHEGYDQFTSRVGSDALVYQPYYTVYGIESQDIEPGVTPLFYSSRSFDEVAVLVDYERKIAATGVYDTTRYTPDAWKLFDLLIGAITPEPPRFTSAQAVAQAYVDSGVYSLLLQVESELARDPNSWEYSEAEQLAWERVSAWHLEELWRHVLTELAGIFAIPALYPELWFTYDPPLRPNVDTLPATSGGIPVGETEHWFLGEYWQWNSLTSQWDVVNNPVVWYDYYEGTDLGLGISAELNGRRIFYLGDTWGIDHDNNDQTPRIQTWSQKDCEVANGVRCDDMIVVTSDNYPDNGIDVSPLFETYLDTTGTFSVISNGWTPLVIPGVHKDISATLEPAPNTYWSTIYQEPTFSVPTGAVSTYVYYTVPNLYGGSITLPLPLIMVWYGTAVTPPDAFDDTDPQKRPTSWAAVSFDGETFYPAYEDSGDVVPFSADIAPDCQTPNTPCNQPGDPARFVYVATVDVPAWQHDEICATPAASLMCDSTVYDSATSQGGLLLYGSGRPFRKSGLFLAFIKRQELGQVDANGRPVAHYYWNDGTNSGWSDSESDATSLTHATASPPCDSYAQPNQVPKLTNGCWPQWQVWNPDWNSESHLVFGEISARLIFSDDPNVDPAIVLLGNNDWSQWVYAWKAPLSEPWAGDIVAGNPHTTNTSGYGPYIIDSFSDYSFPGSGPGGDIVLWHTTSVWNGTPQNDPNHTPYGVYTGQEVIPW